MPSSVVREHGEGHWKHYPCRVLRDSLTQKIKKAGAVEKYQENYANFRSKGYCDESAQAMAVESMEEGAEQPKRSVRFARMYGLDELA